MTVQGKRQISVIEFTRQELAKDPSLDPEKLSKIMVSKGWAAPSYQTLYGAIYRVKKEHKNPKELPRKASPAKVKQEPRTIPGTLLSKTRLQIADEITDLCLAVYESEAKIAQLTWELEKAKSDYDELLKEHFRAKDALELYKKAESKSIAEEMRTRLAVQQGELNLVK